MNTAAYGFCLLEQRYQKGDFSSSGRAGTKSMYISKIIGFIGIAKLSSKTVVPVFPPPFSLESACVTPEVTSSSSREEDWRAIDRSSESANSTPSLKIYVALVLSGSEAATTSQPWVARSPSLAISFPLSNTSHWFSVWLYLLNTKWDWTVICLDLTIPYQTFMI